MTGPNYLAIAVACVCIVALMLPTAEQDKETSSWWSLFHLSSHQKMVFAYTLGQIQALEVCHLPAGTNRLLIEFPHQVWSQW